MATPLGEPDEAALLELESLDRKKLKGVRTQIKNRLRKVRERIQAKGTPLDEVAMHRGTVATLELWRFAARRAAKPPEDFGTERSDSELEPESKRPRTRAAAAEA